MYDELYLESLENFQKRIEDNWEGEGWLVDFYPSLGIRSGQCCDLLFYGQAVNGWRSGFDPYVEIPKGKVLNSVIASNRFCSELDHNPLDWVNVRYSKSLFNHYSQNEFAKKFYAEESTYWTYRSFFWKLVYKLTCDHHGISRESREWSQKVVWSNLYKIAEDGANPNEFFRELQFEASARLVLQEISEIKPRFCVVVTNLSWWQPFHEVLRTTRLPLNKELKTIEAVEELKVGSHLTKIIVTTRPYLGSGEQHVADILKVIRS